MSLYIYIYIYISHIYLHKYTVTIICVHTFQGVRHHARTWERKKKNKQFCEVSALVCLLCKTNIYRTFQHLCRKQMLYIENILHDSIVYIVYFWILTYIKNAGENFSQRNYYT